MPEQLLNFWLSGIFRGARRGLPNLSHISCHNLLAATRQDTGIWQSPSSKTTEIPKESVADSLLRRFAF
jgi:hypothetical protein